MWMRLGKIWWAAKRQYVDPVGKFNDKPFSPQIFFFFLGHIVPFTRSHYFQPQRFWKWTLVAPGNKALELWIICSIFILLVSCLLEASVEWYKFSGPGKAWDRPSVCSHEKKVRWGCLILTLKECILNTSAKGRLLFSFDCSLNLICFTRALRTVHQWRMVFILGE